MKFQIKHRWNGSVLFTAEIETGEDTHFSIRLGLAVKKAIDSSADLRFADLRSADLSYADLRSADLSYAENVGDFTMSDGIKFSDYKRDVVPALLTSGGKILDDIRAAGAWECHEWTNCPMAIAFSVDRIENIPPLYRARAQEFIKFF